MTEKQKKRLSLLAIAIYTLFCLLVMVFIGVPMVHLAEEPEVFRSWVDSFGFWGQLIFIGMVVLQVIVALIPGEPLELAAGYAFGAVEGTVLCMIGILIGSWVVFGAVRCFGPKLLEVFFRDREIRRLAFLRNSRKSGALALILMTIPGTPKDLLSYFAGLTPLTLKQWLGIVSVSRIPSLVSSTVSGAAAGNENYLLAGVLLLVTLAVSGVGIHCYRKICKEQESC